MGRRRRDEPDFISELFAFLLTVPIWVGPIVAFVFFAGLRWAIPWTLSGEPDPEDLIGKPLWPMLAKLSVMIAPWMGGATLVLWIMAELRKLMDGNRLDRQTDIDSIRALNWREFELLLSEAFRRQGYFVEHCGDAGRDGGVDQRLTRAGEVTLVQCKHWRVQKIGVKIVRELRGVMASENATTGMVVTSGGFTPDAVEFARNNQIRLIDGRELERLIREVQVASPQRPPAPAANERVEQPSCPRCGSPMTERTGKYGQFWGCTKFPKCKGTRN